MVEGVSGENIISPLSSAGCSISECNTHKTGVGSLGDTKAVEVVLHKQIQKTQSEDQPVFFPLSFTDTSIAFEGLDNSRGDSSLGLSDTEDYYSVETDLSFKSSDTDTESEKYFAPLIDLLGQIKKYSASKYSTEANEYNFLLSKSKISELIKASVTEDIASDLLVQLEQVMQHLQKMDSLQQAAQKEVHDLARKEKIVQIINKILIEAESFIATTKKSIAAYREIVATNKKKSQIFADLEADLICLLPEKQTSFFEKMVYDCSAHDLYKKYNDSCKLLGTTENNKLANEACENLIQALSVKQHHLLNTNLEISKKDDWLTSYLILINKKDLLSFNQILKKEYQKKYSQFHQELNEYFILQDLMEARRSEGLGAENIFLQHLLDQRKIKLDQLSNSLKEIIGRNEQDRVQQSIDSYQKAYPNLSFEDAKAKWLSEQTSLN